MKRLLAALLALRLLCGAFALAEITQDKSESDMLITFDAVECTDFTVTIPSTVIINDQGTGKLDVGVDASKVNVQGFTIKVTVASENGFKLVNESKTGNGYSYSIIAYDQYNANSRPDPIGAGTSEIVYQWSCDILGSRTSPEPPPMSISMSSLPGAKEAGEYEDILTFTVKTSP